MVTKAIHDSIPTNPTPHNDWHSPQKTSLRKTSFVRYFTKLARKDKMTLKTNMFTFIPHSTSEY